MRYGSTYSLSFEGSFLNTAGGSKTQKASFEDEMMHITLSSHATCLFNSADIRLHS